jgi:hypothetical protein
LRSGLSRRAALRRAGGGLAAGLSVALGQGHAANAQQATPTPEGADKDYGGFASERLYGQVSGALAAQAQRSGLAIDADGVAFSMTGKNLVAMAPAVSSEPGFSQPGPVALLYYSLTSIACADLANGFYTLELVRDNDLAPLGQPYPGKFEAAVQFVDANGKVVAKRTFTRDVMREEAAEPSAKDPASVGDVMRQAAWQPAEESTTLDEVLIQDSPSQMGVMDVILHRKKHYYSGPIIWWEWFYGGT